MIKEVCNWSCVQVLDGHPLRSRVRPSKYLQHTLILGVLIRKTLPLSETFALFGVETEQTDVESLGWIVGIPRPQKAVSMPQQVVQEDL